MNTPRRVVRKRGIALFFILATIMVVSILVYGIIFFLRSEVHLTENYVDGTVALMLAEAGIEESVFTIKKHMNNSKSPIYKMITGKSEDSMTIDLGILEGRVAGVEPVVPGGKVRAKVSWKQDPAATANLPGTLPVNVLRAGFLTVDALGEFHGTKRQVQIKKEIKAIRMMATVPGNSLGMIAPNHGFFIGESHPESFKVKPFDFWDPWGFSVEGGKVYMKDGVPVDLTKWMMLTQFRNELEHPWLDMGIGWTGWNGGATFQKSNQVEYTEDPVERRYHKWQGLFHWPWWETVREPYNSNTRKVEEPKKQDINLYPVDVYRRLANRVVDPIQNPGHAKYFTDVQFREAYGKDQVSYQNVVPLFGWGDWRNVPTKYSNWLSNPTRAHDTSHAVEINGLTFIRGDVFLEGWVKGKGLLVVQGNVYIGGDVVTLPDDSGAASSLGIIALRDEQFDHSKENPVTGRIVFKPHHDSDWSRFGITHPFIDLHPHWEGCFYAQGGVSQDTDSTMKKLINMEIVGNLVTEYFDRRRMPNDVKIKYFDWQRVLAQSSYDYTVDHRQEVSEKYEVSMQKELVSWREVDAVL